MFVILSSVVAKKTKYKTVKTEWKIKHLLNTMHNLRIYIERLRVKILQSIEITPMLPVISHCAEAKSERIEKKLSKAKNLIKQHHTMIFGLKNKVKIQ